jgi:hypothetical protein
LDNRLLFGERKFATVGYSFKDKWYSSGAIREDLLFNVQSARSSPLASELAVSEGLEGKLNSPFVLE